MKQKTNKEPRFGVWNQYAGDLERNADNTVISMTRADAEEFARQYNEEDIEAWDTEKHGPCYKVQPLDESKKVSNSLPYFDSVRDMIVLGTKDGIDHGCMVFIGRDPMSGHRNRYSVLKIDCQNGKTTNHAREVGIRTAREIQSDIVKELVAEGYKDPRMIAGWCQTKKVEQ